MAYRETDTYIYRGIYRGVVRGGGGHWVITPREKIVQYRIEKCYAILY